MKTLIKRHQAATWERGQITPQTTTGDFIAKMDEEYTEVMNAYADDVKADTIPSSEFIHECIDLAAVITNMLTFYGVDFVKEFRKNVEYQESRI